MIKNHFTVISTENRKQGSTATDFHIYFLSNNMMSLMGFISQSFSYIQPLDI